MASRVELVTDLNVGCVVLTVQELVLSWENELRPDSLAEVGVRKARKVLATEVREVRISNQIQPSEWITQDEDEGNPVLIGNTKRCHLYFSLPLRS